MSTFGFETTALEVVEGVDLSGKRAIVTGGASGIGVETVRALAKAGAEVTIAARDVDAGEQVATETGALNVAYLDLAKLDSVEAFARGWDGPLHILVNNAGVMAIQELHAQRRRAGDAVRDQPRRALRARARACTARWRPEGARIVSVSSRGHLRSPVIFDDLNFAFRDYDAVRLAYGQSKTANVLFAVGATARWARDGIYANALHAGRDRHQPAAPHRPGVSSRRASRPACTLKTPEQGAATSVLLAARPELEGVGGRYYEDCNEAAGRRAARRAAAAASRPTRWTPTTRTGCGSCPNACSARTSGNADERG